MARYIDADALLDIFKTLKWDASCSIVEDMPTADVVRCKDCIHHKKFFGRNEYYCDVFDWHSRRMDYCSFGERKEEDE